MKEVRVKVADYAVSADPAMLVTTGLGSCVAVALHDPVACVGGLAHVLLPTMALARDRSNRARFAATAVPLLLEEMAAVGAHPDRVRAKLAGGACMFAALMPIAGLAMGERNVLAVREALDHAGIAVVAQDVGGEHGRSVFFDTRDGRVVVKSVRQGDVIL